MAKYVTHESRIHNAVELKLRV